MAETDSKRVLTLRRQIRSPQNLIFDALTNPVKLSTWFTRNAAVDLRVGGRYSNADRDTGVYLAIDAPKQLRFTWENADHCPNTVVDIHLNPVTSIETEVLLAHSLLESPGHVDEMSVGWNWALDSLKSFLETGKPIDFETWQKSNQ